MLKTNPQVLFQKLGEDGVLLHIPKEEYYGLNEVGVRFWEEFNKLGTVHAVIDLLVDEFHVTKEVLSTDIQELVELLTKEDLLVDV